MTDDISRLEQEIAELEQALEQVASIPAAAAALRAQINEKQRRLAALKGAASQAPRVSGPFVESIKGETAYIATHQTIQNFFGGEPPEDGARLLNDYLAALCDALAPLRLSRMTEKRRSGAGQSLIPMLHLADVFTNLTLAGEPVVLTSRQVPVAQAKRLVKTAEWQEHSADTAPPEDVRILRVRPVEASGGRPPRVHGETVALADLPDNLPVDIALCRPRLALEALAAQPRTVLLGAPGSGKSTVLVYLALLLAHHLRHPEQYPLPFGWTSAPVPLLCPLGRVADALAQAPAGQSDAETLWKLLEQQLDGGGLRPGLGRHLRPALRRGAVALLFDGLDEISARPGANGISLRARVSRAVQAMARELPRTAPVAITCRVLPYEQAGDAGGAPGNDWRLPADDGWVVERIQPLAFGQVRQFVGNWYAAAARTADAIYTPDEAAQRAGSLLEQLAQSERLRELVQSPLLLTMLALLHYNKETGELPRDRARLYDECVELLLERWEPVRQPGMVIPGLLERLGIADRASGQDLRVVMHRVALQAHALPPQPGDGRGLLRGSELEGEMSRFLRRLQCDRIEERLEDFERALRDETGLLLAVGEDTYAFPHLSFQEYLAACALADDPAMGRRAYSYWSSADGDRWREVLLLLVGRLRQQGKIESQGVEWLRILLHTEEPLATSAASHEPPPKRAPKPVNQQARDALLAADSYLEWGGRAALAGFEEEEARQLEKRIARRLAESLHPDGRLSLGERLRVGRHLGQLGDPRFPVTLDEWRASLKNRSETFGAPQGYWCYVPGGRYRIGGWERGETSADLNLRPFWIARFPITVAQYRAFIEDGGYARDDWTPHGRAWRDAEGRTQPWRWDEPQYASPNQPVIGVTWYEATAFCAWLCAQCATALPDGYAIRLPTEAEWEVAAAYDGDWRRAYPWGNDEPTLERAIYKESGLSAAAPVGVCPAGAAACGALDMAGNVWEATTSSYRGYPAGSSQWTKDFTTDEWDTPWRGGSYWQNSTYVRCGARDGDRPVGVRSNYDGFRIVVAPHSH